jgi:Helix-turn-helix domain
MLSKHRKPLRIEQANELAVNWMELEEFSEQMPSLGKEIVFSPDQERSVVSAEAAEAPDYASAGKGLFDDQGERSSRPEPYVDAREGASFLKMHPKTLMRLAREGSVPAYSISEGTRRHWRFLISELDKWMKTKVNSNAHPVRSVSPGRRK